MPILMIWVGVGAPPAVVTAFVISFFPIVVNVATGLATIEPEMRDVLRSLGATRTEILTKVGIPRAMPYLFASLKVAITLGLHRLGDLRDGGRQPRHRLPDAVGGRAQRRAHHLRRPVCHRRDGRRDVRRLRPGRKRMTRWAFRGEIVAADEREPCAVRVPAQEQTDYRCWQFEAGRFCCAMALTQSS